MVDEHAAMLKRHRCINLRLDIFMARNAGVCLFGNHSFVLLVSLDLVHLLLAKL